MKKLIKIIEIHPNDAFYSYREKIIGERGTIETDDIWGSYPDGYYSGTVRFDDSVRIFHAFKYEDIRDLPLDNIDIVSSLKEIKRLLDKLIDDAEQTTDNPQ